MARGICTYAVMMILLYKKRCYFMRRSINRNFHRKALVSRNHFHDVLLDIARADNHSIRNIEQISV